MNRTKKIKTILEKHLINFEIIVTDNSKSHAGHGNFDGYGETHIIIELKSKLQSKIDRLEIHKKINFLLKDEFKLGLHALQIKII